MSHTLRAFAITLALALGACAQLGADAPLFTVADQTGAPPLTEGVWVSGEADCPFDQIATLERFPPGCTPFEVRRDADGAWLFLHRLDLAEEVTEADRLSAEAHPGPLRLILAPAVERPIPADFYAPLYLAELDDEDDPGTRVLYLAIAPRGPLPATSLETFIAVSCDAALRDGPIAGVTAVYEDSTGADGSPARNLRSCTATTQAAVREAVRRAAIEDASNHDRPERFVFVRAISP